MNTRFLVVSCGKKKFSIFLPLNKYYFTPSIECPHCKRKNSLFYNEDSDEYSIKRFHKIIEDSAKNINKEVSNGIFA